MLPLPVSLTEPGTDIFQVAFCKWSKKQIPKPSKGNGGNNKNKKSVDASASESPATPAEPPKPLARRQCVEVAGVGPQQQQMMAVLLWPEDVRDVLFRYLLRFLYGESGVKVVPRMLYVMGPRPHRFHALEFLAVRHLLGVPRCKTFRKITTDTHHRVHGTTDDDGVEDSPVARSGAYVCLRDRERRFLFIAYDDGSANRSEPLFLRGDRTNLPTDAETVMALLRSVPTDALHAEAGLLASYLLDDRAGMQRTLDAIHASVNLDVRCALRANCMQLPRRRNNSFAVDVNDIVGTVPSDAVFAHIHRILSPLSSPPIGRCSISTPRTRRTRERSRPVRSRPVPPSFYAGGNRASTGRRTVYRRMTAWHCGASSVGYDCPRTIWSQ